MSKLVLGISGSPRKGKNNEQTIELALKTAKERGFETEKISVSGMELRFCNACNACMKEEECVFDDDSQKANELMKKADAIIISSPVYYGMISAQVKAIFDRTLPLRRHGFLLKNKIGAAIATGRSRNGGQEHVIQQIHAWMHIHGMIVVGDDNHFGGIVQAPLEKDDTGKQTIIDTANKVCDVLERLS